MRFSLAVPALFAVLALPLPLRAADAPTPPLSKEQQAAAGTALKALRKLAAAVVIGVTLDDYRERLIDTKAAVEEQTRRLPAGPVKALLGEAVESYTDAFRLWKEVSAFPFKGVFKRCESFAFVAKYGLAWTEPKEDPEEIPEFQQHLWVSQVWDAAKARTEQADTAAG